MTATPLTKEERDQCAPNFAKMLFDFGEQEAVFRMYSREYNANNVELQIKDAVRDHLTAFVGFLTRRFADYTGRPSVTQDNAEVSTVTSLPSLAPTDARTQQRISEIRERLKVATGRADGWERMQSYFCHHDAGFLLSLLAEREGDREALIERDVYRSGDGYELWRVVGLGGQAFITADQALDAFRAARSSGGNTK